MIAKMPIVFPSTSRLAYAAACCVQLLALCPVARGEDATLGASRNVTPLLQAMSGTWQVQQRMWLGPNGRTIDLSPAIAHRRLIQDAFLEETMQATAESGPQSFTRTSFLNYNVVSRQYEYFSLDTRAPQQMRYESGRGGPQGTGDLKLRGGRFVAQQWGDAKSVPFAYRLTVGQVIDDRQVVRLYLAPQSKAGKEFLAFEYVYARQR